jgi:hypothetical protein
MEQRKRQNILLFNPIENFDFATYIQRLNIFSFLEINIDISRSTHVTVRESS